MNVLSLVANFQRFTVVALPTADIARHIDVRQEMHLDFDDAITLAGFAATAFDIETEASWHIAARARLLRACKQFTNRCEQATVGRRVRARSASDRTLADIDDFVDGSKALQPLVRCRIAAGAVYFLGHGLVEGVINQRRLARAGYAGNTGHEADGDRCVNVLEVIAGCAKYANL